MAKSTSLLFDHWTALYDRLRAATWPPHPHTSQPVQVVIGAPVGEPDFELVAVVGRVDRADQEFATLGSPSKDETFVLQVHAESWVPGMDDAATVVHRLRDLAAVVEDEMRDSSTGRPIPLDADAVTVNTWVSRIDPQVFPADGVGFVGTCDIYVTCIVRI